MVERCMESFHLLSLLSLQCLQPQLQRGKGWPLSGRQNHLLIITGCIMGLGPFVTVFYKTKPPNYFLSKVKLGLSGHNKRPPTDKLIFKCSPKIKLLWLFVIFWHKSYIFVWSPFVFEAKPLIFFIIWLYIPLKFLILMYCWCKILKSNI